MKYFALSEISNSKVLICCDFDIPLDNKQNIVSDYRIKRCLPTILTLLKNHNQVVLLTKLGRPVNKEESLSTKNIVSKIKYLLGENIYFENQLSNVYKDLDTKKVVLFENTRFFDWENIDYLKNHPEKAKEVSEVIKQFDYFIDEAFALSHRREASNYFFPKIIENIAAGENYLNEIKHLAKIRIGRFERPAYFVFGGAKAGTKIPLMKDIIKHFDLFLVGGLMPKEILSSPDLSASLQGRSYLADLVPSGLDITTDSINQIVSRVSSAATIVWNGPLGKFESDLYQNSTISLIKAIESNTKAVKIIGGGDTILAVEKFGNFKNYTFISTGGGAMFSFLANKKTNLESMGMQF